MKSGFELLITRSVDEQLDISTVEKQFGFSMAPVYKLFVSTFHLGKDSFKREYFLHPEFKDKYILAAPLYYPLENNEKWFVSISHFDSLEEVGKEWDSYLKDDKEWQEYGFLRIAGTGQGGGLFLGTREENSDMIFKVVWDREEPYFKVAENIFEFIRGFVITDIPEILPGAYPKSSLFKNWGEAFWRIKES